MKRTFTQGMLHGFTACMAVVAFFAGAFYWMDTRMEERFRQVRQERSRIEKRIEEESIDTVRTAKQLAGHDDLAPPSATAAFGPAFGRESHCPYETDGQCDALGHESSTGLCPPGTDQVDCALSDSRSVDQCIFANDDECDAAGLWGSTNLCPANTDEDDCRGFRLTSDVCRTENDGKCDAMGNPGVRTPSCPVGTDLNDCRSPS